MSIASCRTQYNQSPIRSTFISFFRALLDARLGFFNCTFMIFDCFSWENKLKNWPLFLNFVSSRSVVEIDGVIKMQLPWTGAHYTSQLKRSIIINFPFGHWNGIQVNVTFKRITPNPTAAFNELPNHNGRSLLTTEATVILYWYLSYVSLFTFKHILIIHAQIPFRLRLHEVVDWRTLNIWRDSRKNHFH